MDKLQFLVLITLTVLLYWAKMTTCCSKNFLSPEFVTKVTHGSTFIFTVPKLPHNAGLLDPFYNFTPSEIFPEWLRLEDANFVYGMAMLSISLVMTDSTKSTMARVT